jgi:hypothetical protein
VELRALEQPKLSGLGGSNSRQSHEATVLREWKQWRRMVNVRALKSALIFVVFRLACGVLLIFMQRSSPESSMLVMLDLPTLGSYSVLHLAHVDMNIVDAEDRTFFVIGVATWAILGLAVGWLSRLLKTRRHSDDSAVTGDHR